MRKIIRCSLRSANSFTDLRRATQQANAILFWLNCLGEEAKQFGLIERQDGKWVLTDRVERKLSED